MKSKIVGWATDMAKRRPKQPKTPKNPKRVSAANNASRNKIGRFKKA